MIAVGDVVAASARVETRLRRTPVLAADELGERVSLKAELFQRTGSFKPRGVLNRLAALSDDERARGVVTTSAGNLAAALAYGSALESVDCLVVMWQGASEHKIAAVRRYGAAVDLEATTPGEAFARMGQLQRESGRLLVHPWDDPLVLAGHATVGLEIVEERPDVELVVVPVGGGGLIAGIASVVKALRPDARIVAVEPERAAGLHAALAAGEPVPVEPSSIADGLNAPFVGERCLAICRELVDEAVLVSEDEIRAGFRFLYDRAKLAAEPAGAATAAAILARKVRDFEERSTVLVVSGGNVLPATASAILGEG
ncbi:MAG TPA: pyridoxal-phosphate dependent enzyme [Gaiellaceae bacterium]|nr:pyridoxal-phosphate dependent enzyme [Gaiellaceae bacterium]